MAYFWLKSLHVISIIAWMAGLLYLPRLFVYHTDVDPKSPTSELFKVMERRLERAIMTPAMIASWLFGILVIATQPDFLSQGWLHAKLLLVVGLTATHVFLMRCRRDFAENRNHRPQKFYRFVNEVPTLLMIGIVIIVIVKPF